MEEDYTDKVETQVAQDILHLFGARVFSLVLMVVNETLD
jgi:hypothetical protein